MPRLQFVYRLGIQSLPTFLPGADRLARPHERHDVENQAVANPGEQYRFADEYDQQRPAEADAATDKEADEATEDVTEGVGDGVAFVADGNVGDAIGVEPMRRVVRAVDDARPWWAAFEQHTWHADCNMHCIARRFL